MATLGPVNVTAYKSPPATLYDVCRHTGLSSATVSRVMNDSPQVRPSTRDRILQAARELGYVPSHHARALASKQTRTLGVIFPKIASGFFAEVLEGIDEVAAEQEFHLLAAFSHNRTNEQKLVQQFLHDGRVDCLILMNLLLPDSFVREAATAPTPMVLLDRPVPGAPVACITLDNVRGAEAAMLHLVSLGHRDIAILTGPEGTHDAQERLRGCRQAARAAGLPLDPTRLWPGGFTEESGYQTARTRLLQDSSPPDAIFALNDDMALGALEALQEQGLGVPQHVGLVGFDDVGPARYLQLTTVRCPMRRMGRDAAAAAIQLSTTHEAPANRVLGTELVVRRSCGFQEPRSKLDTRSRSNRTEQTGAHARERLVRIVPVRPGKPYRFSARVRKDSGDPLRGTSRGQISMEWKDPAGREIERILGPQWSHDLPRAQACEFQISAVAPANAATAHCVITEHQGTTPGCGAFLIDTVFAGEAP